MGSLVDQINDRMIEVDDEFRVTRMKFIKHDPHCVPPYKEDVFNATYRRRANAPWVHGRIVVEYFNDGRVFSIREVC